MTVAINATSVKLGGALTYLINLASCLDSSVDSKYILFVADELGLPKSKTQVIRVPQRICSSATALFFWQQLTLPRLLKKMNADLLYSTANFSTFASPCPQVLLIRIPHYFSDLYKKYILPYKSLSEKIDYYLRKHLISLSARVATHVLFQTESTRNDVLKTIRIPASKTSVNVFGTTHSRSVQGRMQTGNFKILCTSHYADYKNYTTLFSALELLVKDGWTDFSCTAPIDLTVPLFNTGISITQDRKLIASPFLKPHLNLVGPVPYSALTNLYADADLFVWPSLAETFGQPLIEAMTAGLPIICSDISVNRELCGNAAIYVPPLDAASWKQAIVNVLKSSDLRRSLSHEGALRARLFTWSGHKERLESLFVRLAP